jgi:hypothetical protein
VKHLNALGVPELSDGHFYRVTSDFLGTSVQIRRERRFGSTFVTEVYVRPEESLTPEYALYVACFKAAGFLRDLEEDRADCDALAEYKGDHK